MKRSLAIGALLVGSLFWGNGMRSAVAAPLDAAAVASGAKWFFHVDFDAARETKVGEAIHAKALKDEHVKKALAKLQDELGFDPQKDLHGATLYGTTFKPHTGVLILYATADKDKFMKHLKAKPDFIALKTADGEHEIYTWTEGHEHKAAEHKASEGAADKAKDGAHKTAEHDSRMHGSRMHGGHMHGGHHPRTVWAAFPKHGVAVFADSAINLTAALDVLGGKGGSTSGSALIPEAPKGTVFSGAVAGLTGAHLPSHLPVISKIEGISFAAGESDGEDFDHIKVTMTETEVAKQVKSIIEGGQAMVALHLANHPEALKMVNGLKAEVTGKTLSIDWKASSDDVLKFGEKACEFIKQHHGQWHHDSAATKGAGAVKPWEKKSEKKPEKNLDK